jgi:hypothetical protein
MELITACLGIAAIKSEGRRLVADGRFRVEANEWGAVRLLAHEGHRFVAVPTLNAPNTDGLTLRLEDPDTLFFNRRLLIEGDTDLGLRVKNMLDGVELEAAARAMPAGIGRVVLSLRALAAD